MAAVARKIREMLSNLRRGDGLSRPDETPFEPMEIDGLTVRCRSSWPDDPAILKAWNDMSIRLAVGTPFHSPAWQIAGWTAGRILGRIRFMTVDRGGELLCVLPLCLNPKGGLHSPGASICDYLDPLMVPEHEPACWRAILAFIAAKWDRKLVEFTLHNNRESAACRSILPTLAEGAGFSLEETLVEYAPAIQLPVSWEQYLESLDAHERKELRRKLNKAETKGNARLAKCEDGSLLDKVLATMEAVGGEKGAAVSGYVRPLLEAIAQSLMREGRLELWTLEILGQPAGYLIQLASSEGPMLYNLGYEPSMKEWSPGVVAVGMSIRNAISAGVKVFDLLRGREPYKHKLGAVDRPLFKLTLRHLAK
jgi:CelD/BcsL family acetyltransferase involved in cellulose biosynthesis